MASLSSCGSTSGSHIVFNATSWRRVDKTASQSRSAREAGRSRLQSRVYWSSPRLATRALLSSTATVSMPTRCGRQQAVTSIANLAMNGLYLGQGLERQKVLHLAVEDPQKGGRAIATRSTYVPVNQELNNRPLATDLQSRAKALDVLLPFERGVGRAPARPVGPRS